MYPAIRESQVVSDDAMIFYMDMGEPVYDDAMRGDCLGLTGMSPPPQPPTNTAEVFGRLQDPPLEDQVPDLSNSADSVSSTNSVEESYYRMHFGQPHPEHSGAAVADLSSALDDMSMGNVYTEEDITVIDPDTIIRDIKNYTYDDADRVLLRAPKLGYIELPADEYN